VAALALRLNDALVAAGCVAGLGDDPLERAMLKAAGLLHDTGMLVSYRGHHRHSEQIVLHNDLGAVPRAWVHRLATLCRHHRRKGPSDRDPVFASLSEAERISAMRLAGILRVADGLDRSHAGVVADLRVSVGKRTLRIECDSGGIDMAAEIDAATRKADVLEALTGLRVCVTRRDSLADTPD
jgi:exopolyphosphatase/guanosine-5'-triphosphate,3'-diphosphate pyrophosphatase